jgi:hypothetical protein
MSSIDNSKSTGILRQSPDPNDLGNRENQSPAKEPVEHTGPVSTPSDEEIKEFEQHPELWAFKEKLFAPKDKFPAPWWERDPMLREAPPTHDNMAVDPTVPRPSQLSPKDKINKM